jgi:hypothetical protein
MDKNCYVYVLYSKKECIVRYIGVSVCPKKRFMSHKHESEISHKYLYKSKWFRKHKDVSFKVIYKGDEKDCYDLEISLIKNNKKKRKLTNLSKGGDAPIKFKDHSLEKQNKIKEKIRKASLGRKIPFETRRKMSESQKKLNKEHLLMYTKGKNNPRAFAVYQYTIDGVFLKKWDYANQAVRELKMNRTAITDCLKGRQKTAKGFVWKSELVK